ncbi:MAG: InlB B-repeat-containing protein, partial [Clostridia bacterium]|nr:InlB B-repeat-containing protein [Clostridia bacterium]
MLCSIIPSIATTVSASTGGHTRAEAVAWANSKIGSALDYDGYYGAQCVDLIYYYYVYLGQSAPGGNARDFANGGKYTPSGWSYQSSPQPGDIAVDSSYSPGHVGIVTKIEGSYMYCVEQNYNYKQYCQEVRRNLYSHGYSTFIRPDFVTTVTCTVTFNPNGGKVSPTSKTVTVGQPYGTLPTPTRSGYVFLGWGASTSATAFYTSSSIVSNSSNHTLYAVWRSICDTEGHSFGAWQLKTAATCTAKGSEQRVCTRCGKTETRSTSSLGHNYVASVVKPTCTAEGYTRHKCSRCSASYTDTYVSALGHNYVEYVIKPACKAKGYTRHKCSRCGDSYVDTYVDALGHAFGKWTVKTAATCTSKGTEERICSRCGNTETRDIPAPGQNYVDNDIKPTCK